jgi:hypothetical protein
MITFNTEFIPTNDLNNINWYMQNNKIKSDHLNVLVVSINDYNRMINDAALDTFFAKALAFGTNRVVLMDNHGWPIIPNNLDQNPIKTIALSYDFNLHNNPKNNSFYYPNWLFFVRGKPKHSVLTPTYPISCAGRNFNNGRAGKIYNYQKLKQQRYFNQILFTQWRNGDFEYFAVPGKQQDPEFYRELEEFVIEYNSWPECNHIELALGNSMGAMDINIHNKSLFHLVAESRIEEPLLSEKTFKTLYTQQIPIFCAASGTVAHLRNLGFDMFDDIINHNKYDVIQDWKQRILTMHTVIDTIIDLDHSELLQITQKRRMNNFNQIMSQTIDQQIHAPIVDALLK